MTLIKSRQIDTGKGDNQIPKNSDLSSVNFRVYASSTPMSFNVGAGEINLYGTTTAYAAQDDVATLVAPVTNPRIDRVVADLFTGVASVVAGTEAVTPVAPDVPPGKVAVAKIDLTTGMTAITDDDIRNELPVTVGTPIRPRYIALPDDFGWPTTTDSRIATRSYSIHRNIAGSYKLNYPEWAPSGLILNPTKDVYYVAPTGDDADPGTLDEPFASLDHVLGLSAARHIILRPGVYFSDQRWSTKALAADCLIEVENGGRAVIGDIERNYTWAATGDAGVYIEESVSQPVSVLAMRFYDDFGVNLSLLEYASLATLVAATSGFYWDGTDLYVKLPDSALPSTKNCYVLNRGTGAGISNARSQVTVRNVDFWGCDAGFSLTSETHVVFDRCNFAYSLGAGLTTMDAYGGVILRKCRAYANRNDGFNYKDSNVGTPTIAVEDNCESFNPGYNGGEPTTEIHNASTSHDSCRILRVGGMYHSTRGPVVADIDDAKSFNAGCVAFGSDTVSTQPASFAVWGNAEMWLEDCYSYGSTYDLWSDDGAQIHHRNLISEGSFLEETPGDIDTY